MIATFPAIRKIGGGGDVSGGSCFAGPFHCCLLFFPFTSPFRCPDGAKIALRGVPWRSETRSPRTGVAPVIRAVSLWMMRLTAASHVTRGVPLWDEAERCGDAGEGCAIPTGASSAGERDETRRAYARGGAGFLRKEGSGHRLPCHGGESGLPGGNGDPSGGTGGDGDLR